VYVLYLNETGIKEINDRYFGIDLLLL